MYNRRVTSILLILVLALAIINLKEKQYLKDFFLGIRMSNWR